MRSYKAASFLSFLGLILILSLIAVSLPSFKGFQGEDYSFSQCFVSELGNPYKNSRFYLLNYGLMIIGILFMPMGVTISQHTKSKVGYIAGFVGFLSMCSLSIVGYFPEHYLRPHIIAAFSFFGFSALTVGMYAILSLTNRRLPQWLFWPSIIPFVLFVSFLIYPKTELHNITSDPWNYVRPDVVVLAVLEWLFFLAMSMWICCVSVFLWRFKE